MLTNAKHPGLRRLAVLAATVVASLYGAAEQRYQGTGMVLSVDLSLQTMTISSQAIPHFMEAMVMTFPVHGPETLGALQAGMTVDFTLVVNQHSSYVENVRVHPFQSLELDPTEARRLRIIENAMGSASPTETRVSIGQPVPDFALTDQSGQRVTLSEFAGKIVAVTFVYSRCPLPNYCFRLSNNFGRLQKRFKDRLGKDLILLSVIIDPVHDKREALANYARIWKADPQAWHFLTGPVPDIEQICRRFNMNFYPDEALLVHSFSTAIIDRQGKMSALLEGNDFTAQQLGDLVQAAMLKPAD
jgi:protein SCO1/2